LTAGVVVVVAVVAALAACIAAPAVAASVAAGATGADTSALGASAAGTGITTGASSFLPQAVKAKAATIAAKTRDLFIFTILEIFKKKTTSGNCQKTAQKFLHVL
jgi:hypothetical protein